MKQILNACMLGAGGWAQETHIPLLQSREDIELSTLTGILTKAEGSELAKKFGFKKYIHDWKEISGSDNIDFVVISTPHDMHFDQAKHFLNNNIHVHIDKPPALSRKELDYLLRLAQKKSLLFSVHAQMKYMPGILQFKQLIEDNFSSIFQVNAYIWQKLFSDFKGSWRANPKKAGGGIMMDSGYHMIDTVHYVLKKSAPETPTFHAHNGAKASDTIGLLTYNLGETIVSVSSIRGAPKSIEGQRIELFGDAGYLKMEINKYEGEKYSEIVFIDSAGESQEFKIKHQGSYKQDPLRMFINNILDPNSYITREIEVNNAVSLDVVDVLSSAYEKEIQSEEY